jgi:hypothetical protein
MKLVRFGNGRRGLLHIPDAHSLDKVNAKLLTAKCLVAKVIQDSAAPFRRALLVAAELAGQELSAMSKGTYRWRYRSKVSMMRL